VAERGSNVTWLSVINMTYIKQSYAKFYFKVKLIANKKRKHYIASFMDLL